MTGPERHLWERGHAEACQTRHSEPSKRACLLPYTRTRHSGAQWVFGHTGPCATNKMRQERLGERETCLCHHSTQVVAAIPEHAGVAIRRDGIWDFWGSDEEVGEPLGRCKKPDEDGLFLLIRGEEECQGSFHETVTDKGRCDLCGGSGMEPSSTLTTHRLERVEVIEVNAVPAAHLPCRGWVQLTPFDADDYCRAIRFPDAAIALWFFPTPASLRAGEFERGFRVERQPLTGLRPEEPRDKKESEDEH